ATFIWSKTCMNRSVETGVDRTRRAAEASDAEAGASKSALPRESQRPSAFRSPLSIHACRYDTGEPIRITVAGGRISAVEPAWPTGRVSDWPLVAPGLFDLQINGYGGVMFADSGITMETAETAIGAYLAHGVTRLFPTLITSSFESLSAGFAAIRGACE